MMLQQPSRLAMSKVWMCDAPVAAEESPAEEKGSVLDDLSAENAALLEQLKGMTLLEASEVRASRARLRTIRRAHVLAGWHQSPPSPSPIACDLCTLSAMPPPLLFFCLLVLTEVVPVRFFAER